MIRERFGTFMLMQFDFNEAVVDFIVVIHLYQLCGMTLQVLVVLLLANMTLMFTQGG